MKYNTCKGIVVSNVIKKFLTNNQIQQPSSEYEIKLSHTFHNKGNISYAILKLY